MLLSLQISCQTCVDILVKQGTLGDQRVDLLLLDLPGNTVDQEGILDRIKLTKHRIIFEILPMQNLHVNIDQLVHLLDT